MPQIASAGISLEEAAPTVTPTGPISKPEKKSGNKPIMTFREGGCCVSLFQNYRKKKDGTREREYRFTLHRTVKAGDEYKTVYSFRWKDVDKVRELLKQAWDHSMKVEAELKQLEKPSTALGTDADSSEGN